MGSEWKECDKCGDKSVYFVCDGCGHEIDTERGYIEVHAPDSEHWPEGSYPQKAIACSVECLKTAVVHVIVQMRKEEMDRRKELAKDRYHISNIYDEIVLGDEETDEKKEETNAE